MKMIQLTDDARRRLTEVVEWLEAGAPHRASVHRFDMATFIDSTPYEPSDPKDCGTTCCIAGAVVQFDRLANGWPPYQVANAPSSFSMEHEAASLLSLDERESYELFYAHGINKSLGRVRPAEAVQVLRHLLDTGVLDWTVINEDHN